MIQTGDDGQSQNAAGKTFGGIVSGGLAAGLPGAIIGGVTGLLGQIGAKKRAENQIKQQQQLNEHAAATNYKYGEMAAQNAYARQQEMYERTLEDNSAAAQKKRYEEAGMNPALMMAGGAGSGNGVVAGAPQAATGGAIAGQADSPVAKGMLTGQRIQTGLQMAQMQANIELTQAQARELNTRADKTGGVDTNLTNLQAEFQKIENKRAETKEAIESAQKPAHIEQATFLANQMWIQYQTIIEEYENAHWTNEGTQADWQEKREQARLETRNMTINLLVKAAQIANLEKSSDKLKEEAELIHTEGQWELFYRNNWKIFRILDLSQGMLTRMSDSLLR